MTISSIKDCGVGASEGKGNCPNLTPPFAPAEVHFVSCRKAQDPSHWLENGSSMSAVSMEENNVDMSETTDRNLPTVMHLSGT